MIDAMGSGGCEEGEVTPLAHHIVKELTLPIKRRSFEDDGKLIPKMDDIHCFEVSEAMPLAQILKMKLPEVGIDARSTFLPAPKTWIEWREIGEDGTGYRFGMLLLEDVKSKKAKIIEATAFNSIDTERDLPLVYSACPKIFGKRLKALKYLASRSLSDEELLAILSIINSPRVIGRRQHMPHRGLERKLVGAKGIVGKFPLHAWTEIKLEIGQTKNKTGDPSIEAHYTGERALHFCRAHLRIRFGRLEIVRSHWRGDGSLGIKQSRYKLIEARQERLDINAQTIR